LRRVNQGGWFVWFGLVRAEFFWQGVDACADLWSEFSVGVLRVLTAFLGSTPVLIMVFGWATPTGVAAEIKFNALKYYPADSHF
jgi:hypothetical protein